MAIGEGRMVLGRVQVKATGVVSVKVTKIDAAIAKQIPLPETHRFYPLIGRVAAEWAYLEHILDLINWDLTKGDKAANSCITGQIMNYLPKFRAIEALAMYYGYDKATVGDIRSLKGKVQRVVDKRNRYVHDAWFLQTIGESTDKVGQFKSYSERDNQFGFAEIKEKEVLECVDKIRNAAKSASALRSSLLTKRPS